MPYRLNLVLIFWMKYQMLSRSNFILLLRPVCMFSAKYYRTFMLSFVQEHCSLGYTQNEASFVTFQFCAFPNKWCHNHVWNYNSSKIFWLLGYFEIQIYITLICNYYNWSVCHNWTYPRIYSGQWFSDGCVLGDF